MILLWKSFKIDLNSFNQFLQINIEKADGIVASPDQFQIIEKTEFDQIDIDTIFYYYNSLTEEEENIKITRPQRLIEAIDLVKESILVKDLTSLTIIERKIFMNMALTTEEENQILT